MLFRIILVFLLIVLFFIEFFEFFFIIIFFIIIIYFLSISNLCIVSKIFINNIYIYMDLVSFLLCILVVFIIVVICVDNFSNKDIYLYIAVCLIQISLLFCFFSCNLILFYIFFEFSIIPLFYIILYKGFNIERFIACLYILLYTLISSFLFLLLCINMSYNIFIFFDKNLFLFFNEEGVIWFFMIIVFLVKIPLYIGHSWLRKAHVEAPVRGSMLLAGVLLKLGCFGVYRVVYFINFNVFYFFCKFLVIFSLIGAIYSCIICMRQIDIKILIAYSSVRHIRILVRAMFRMSKIGWSGRVGIILGHGLCSRCLFFISNILYNRLHTRNLLILKRVFNYYPVVYFFWLIFVLINIGRPPLINFFSEIMLVISILKISIITTILLGAYLLLVIYYNLCIFLRFNHGSLIFFWKLKKERFLEMFVIFIHLLISLIFICCPNLFFILNF